MEKRRLRWVVGVVVAPFAACPRLGWCLPGDTAAPTPGGPKLRLQGFGDLHG